MKHQSCQFLVLYFLNWFNITLTMSCCHRANSNYKCLPTRHFFYNANVFLIVTVLLTQYDKSQQQLQYWRRWRHMTCMWHDINNHLKWATCQSGYFSYFVRPAMSWHSTLAIVVRIVTAWKDKDTVKCFKNNNKARFYNTSSNFLIQQQHYTNQRMKLMESQNMLYHRNLNNPN